MSLVFQLKLTQTGQTAVWNANNTGTSLNLTHIQFGSGNRAPSGTETALLIPQQAVAIAAGFSVSSTQIRMSGIFSGNQNYVVREVGLWAGDPAVGGSKLVGYWSQAAGDLAMKSPGVDFIFSHDMTLDAAVPAGSLTILADNAQSAMLAMITAHEAAANPHNQYATKAGVQVQTYTAFTTAGAAPTFTLTASPVIAAYAAGQRFRVKFGAAGNGADTLNVNALGAKSLKQYDRTGAKVAAVITANQLADVEYDGVDFVILDPLPSAGGQQIFTANGTFTVPAGVSRVFVSLCGGGGGGSGGVLVSSSDLYAGGGGGGGQCYLRSSISVVPGQVIAVTVGSGGAGGSGRGNGVAGGVSSFGALLAASGGGGGVYSTVGGNGGAAGGAGGQKGGEGTALNGATHQVVGGYGGGTLLGIGGTPSYSGNDAGAGYGAGGAGGPSRGALSAGGAGAPGVCIVEW